MFIMNYIGANIRRERLKAGLEQEKLASAIGLDQTTISRFENGSRRPTVYVLKKMASALNCSFYALVNEDQDNSEEQFVRTLLAQNQEVSEYFRSLADRSDELLPEDWQFFADHLKHVFAQVEIKITERIEQKPR